MTKALSLLVASLGLLALACSGSSEPETAIWHDDSASIDFQLFSLATQRCTFTAARNELTQAQLDGLSALRLQEARSIAGCDGLSYKVSVRAQSGPSTTYLATEPECSNNPILLFDAFDAWAKTTPCSSAAQ